MPEEFSTTELHHQTFNLIYISIHPHKYLEYLSKVLAINAQLKLSICSAVYFETGPMAAREH